MILRQGAGLKAASLAVAIAMLSGACTSSESSGQTMRLQLLEGAARLVRDDGTQTIRSESEVAPGDRIVLDKGSSAELRLGPGRVFELNGSEVEVMSSARLILRRGNLLADLNSPGEVGIESARVTATRGAFRVDRALASRVGVYKGTATLSGSGDRLPIPQLRQAIVAGGIIPSAPQPLRLGAGDRWDRRYLEQILDLDARLTNFGRGLEAQLGEGVGPEFWGAVTPIGIDVAFLSAFVENRRSDILIGLMIAIQSTKESVPLGQRFSEIFALWNEDASWGLIAYEFGVSEVNLFTLLVEAIGRAGLIVIGTGSGPGLRRPRPQRPSGGGGSTSPSPSPRPEPTSPSPTSSPTVPVPGPVDSAVPDPAKSEVDNVVCGLLGSTACTP